MKWLLVRFPFGAGNAENYHCERAFVVSGDAKGTDHCGRKSDVAEVKGIVKGVTAGVVVGDLPPR